MKKQRWRKTKPKMKKWFCDFCGDLIKVYRPYKPVECCSGFECACMGLPTNPIFCGSCEIKIFGERRRSKNAKKSGRTKRKEK